MAGIMKEKEEMEEFLMNLGMEYRFSCYKEFNPEGDYVKAVSVLDFTCKQYKYFKSCNTLGVFEFEGRGTKKNLKKALGHFQTACDGGSAEGCYHLGQMLAGKDEAVVSAGVKPDIPKAIAALEKGCDLGQPSSCFEAGAAHLAGQKFGVTPDPEKAFKLMELACNHFCPHFEACNNLMLMHRRGIGTKKDAVAAAKVQEKLDDYINLITKKKTIEMQQGT